MSDKGKIELSLGISTKGLKNGITAANKELERLSAPVGGGSSAVFNLLSTPAGRKLSSEIKATVRGEKTADTLSERIKSIGLPMSIEEMVSEGNAVMLDLAEISNSVMRYSSGLKNLKSEIDKTRVEGDDKENEYYATRNIRFSGGTYTEGELKGKKYKGVSYKAGEKLDISNPAVQAQLTKRITEEDVLSYYAIEKEIEASDKVLNKARQKEAAAKKYNKVVGEGYKIIYNYEKEKSKTVKKEEKARKEAERKAAAEKKALEQAQSHAANIYRLNAAYTVFSNTLRVVVRGANSLIQSFAKYDQALTRFELNFGSSEGTLGLFNQQVESTIKNLSTLQGFSASGLRTIANDFYEMVRSFGVAQTEASAFTSTFVQDVAKVSRATGQSLDIVSAAIQRAVATGESEAVLNQLNIDLRKTTLKTWMVEKGLIADKNAEINEGLRSLATQLYLHEAIANNENLSKNRGQEQLVAQEQIRNNLEEIKQTGGSILAAVITPATQGLQAITKGISIWSQEARTMLPVFKYAVGGIGAILTGVVAVGTAWLASSVLIKKISVLMKELIGDQTLLGMTSAKWVSILKTGVPLLSGSLLLFSGAGSLIASFSKDTDKTNEALKDTTNITDSMASSLDDVQKKSEQAKGSLMGFDKLNVLSMGKSTVNTESMSDIWKDQNEDLESLLENTDKYNDKMSRTISIITTLIGLGLTLKGIGELINLQQTKSVALGAISNRHRAKELGLSTALIQSRIKEAGALKVNTKEQRKNNTQRGIGVALKSIMNPWVLGALALGAVAVAGVMGSMNKSANGNFFPRASTTVIGEKYPEVAIPLGQSPQYAEMKQSIAKSVVEMLGGQAGEIKIVNQTVLDGRVIDERIRKVSRQDYKNQTGSNYKNVAMRK